MRFVAAFCLVLSISLTFLVLPAVAGEDYICPMHPHIHGSEGDTCPICGMALVPARGTVSPDVQEHENATLSIPDIQESALVIRTDKATERVFGPRLRSFGRVVPDRARMRDISLQAGGWVRELRVTSVGEKVRKGDVLFTLYSPDMISAQSDYLLGRSGKLLASATERRLRLSGMDEAAVALLQKSGRVVEEVPFHAPGDMVVTEINIRPGSYAEAGGVAMALADLSSVWIEAAVPQARLSSISVGGRADVTVAGKKMESSVAGIYPSLEGETYAAVARIAIDNGDGTILHGMYADVDIVSEPKKRLSVPSAAIIREHGDAAHVFRRHGKEKYESVPVRTGVSADGWTEILSGLKAGDDVVVSGQFMLDAETALSNAGGGSHAGH